jgi:hypothetical protein
VPHTARPRSSLPLAEAATAAVQPGSLGNKERGSIVEEETRGRLLGEGTRSGVGSLRRRRGADFLGRRRRRRRRGAHGPCPCVCQAVGDEEKGYEKEKEKK